jgi:phosphoesterase, MJ0936 family
MKVLIVSDTHRRDENLKEAIEQTKPFDMLIHLGDAEGSEELIAGWLDRDCKAAMVLGNNDFFSDLEKEVEVDIGAYHTLLTHGHYYNVSLGVEGLVREAKARSCNMVMYGHTHRPYLEEVDGIIVVNPGSISYPRQEGRQPTYLILELDEEGKLHFQLKHLS